MGVRGVGVAAVVAALVGTTLAGTSAGAAPSLAAATAPTVSRLAGADRVGTAVAISQHAFPAAFTTGGSVYLARMDVFADAVAAGTLTDGPVLLTPSCGAVPKAVLDEVTRLAPARVVALGGTGAVCDQVLADASAGRPTARLAGVDRYLTSLEIARERARQGPITEVYIASGLDSPDAVVGGQLTRGPILLTGTVDRSADYKAFISEVTPLRVVALGGPGAVDDSVLSTIAVGAAHTGRLAGRDRYGSSAAVAMRQFPEDADTVYLARADVFADAVASGALKDGPILLVGQCSLPTSTRERIAAARPLRVIALGGPGAVCDSVLAQAAAAISASGGRLSVGWVDSSGWPTGTIYSSKIAAGGRHLLVHGAGLDGAATDTLMVLDLATGTKENVGILPGGTAAVVWGYDQFDISADGRFVVFLSASHSMGDTDGDVDVFRRDLVENRTDLISSDASRAWGAADAGEPKVSDDGRTVAFTMRSGTGGYVWVSGPAASGRIDFKNAYYGNDASILLDLSADARYVLFRTRATNLVPGVGSGGWDVVRASVPDAPWGEMVKVNVKPVALADRVTGSLSGDGSTVAYSWPVDELAGDDASGDLRSFVRDVAMGSTSRIAGVRPSGLRAEDSRPVISDDGRWVAFVTEGPPPAPEPKLAYPVVQLANRASGKSTWVSSPFDGSLQLGGGVGVVSLAATGDRVSFPTSLKPLLTGSDYQHPLVALWTRLSPR